MSIRLILLLLISLSQQRTTMAAAGATSTSSSTSSFDVHESSIFEDTARIVPPPSSDVPVAERHNRPPSRKQAVDEQSSSSSKLSYYMESDCRPRDSGYFGSTGGDPAVIEYGFELEATIFANIDQILTIIDDHVMDEILTSTFSNICSGSLASSSSAGSLPLPSSSTTLALSSGGTRRRKTRNRELSLGYKDDPDAGRVTGFKFSKETVDESMTCTAQLHERNSCGFYKSQIKIYGYNMDGGSVAEETLSHLRTALPRSLAEAAKRGAVRLELAEGLTKQVSGPGMEGNTSNSHSMGAGAKVGLVLAVTVIFIGVGVLAVYCFMDRRERRRRAGKMDKNGRKFSRYYDTNSLTNTYQATESDESEDRSPNSSREHSTPRFTPRKPDWNRLFFQRHDRLPEKPIMLEWGPSFDPVRDRFLKELEDESSAPPDYAIAMARSSDFSLRDIQII